MKGYFRKHPDRRREGEPVCSHELGPPPAHLSADAVAAWEEIAGNAPEGVLWASDRLLVEITANLLAEYRRDPAAFPAGKHSVLRSHMATMGFSPSSRAGLSVPQKLEDNPFLHLED
jgi:hypothetical protein